MRLLYLTEPSFSVLVSSINRKQKKYITSSYLTIKCERASARARVCPSQAIYDGARRCDVY